MRNIYILHLLMFSRWWARWNFNGVLMATARATELNSCSEKKDEIARERKTEKGNKQKKNVDEDRRDSPHVSLPWNSECIYSSVDFKFLPLTIFYSSPVTGLSVFFCLFMYDICVWQLFSLILYLIHKYYIWNIDIIFYWKI